MKATSIVYKLLEDDPNLETNPKGWLANNKLDIEQGMHWEVYVGADDPKYGFSVFSIYPVRAGDTYLMTLDPSHPVALEVIQHALRNHELDSGDVDYIQYVASLSPEEYQHATGL